MKKITSREIVTTDIFKKIGDEWMLIGAEKGGKMNVMTASWGGVGVLWNMDVATCYIRPTRYTKEFCDASDCFTLSFYPDEMKEGLSVCGTKSGRDCDKLKEAGFEAVIEEKAAYCKGASLVIVCEKLYAQDFEQKCFIDKTVIDKCYPKRDFHTMYVGKILYALVSD